MQLTNDFEGRVALVTGGSSGIGRATARMLAGLGAKVAFTYLNNEKGAAETLGAIQRAGQTGYAVKADVSRREECAKLISDVSRVFGPVQILVNNAGTLARRVPLAEMSDSDWHQILNINLTSAFMCSQVVAPTMIQARSGAIVNVVSIAARNGGGHGTSHYSAAKAGLIAFSKNIARELAPHGIRVNCVSPGFIDTPFHEQVSTPEIRKAAVASIPMGRAGKPEEVASVIAFLCSGAASYVCGETIEINGGQLML